MVIKVTRSSSGAMITTLTVAFLINLVVVAAQTPSASPSWSPSSTHSPSWSPSSTHSHSWSPSSTHSHSWSPSHSKSWSPSHSHSWSPSSTHSKSWSPSHSHSWSPSSTHSKSWSPSSTHSHSWSPSHSHSWSPSSTHSKSWSPSHSHSWSPSSTHSKSWSPSHSHSWSPSSTHSHSWSPSHSHSWSPSSTHSKSWSPSHSHSWSPSHSKSWSPSHSHSWSPSSTHSRSWSPSHSHSWSPSHSHSWSPSHSHSWSPSHSRSWSPSSTHSRSWSPSHSHSWSPSSTHSKSWSPSSTHSRSWSPSHSHSWSPSSTHSKSWSPSSTHSRSWSPSVTPSWSPSMSHSWSPSSTDSRSWSPSSTMSPSWSPSVTKSWSPSVTPSISNPLSLVMRRHRPIAAQCPNKCSGHGKCSVDGRCLCNEISTGPFGSRFSYTGADCSQRACEVGPAFGAISSVVDEVTSVRFASLPDGRIGMNKALHAYLSQNLLLTDVEVVIYMKVVTFTGTHGTFQWKFYGKKQPFSFPIPFTTRNANAPPSDATDIMLLSPPDMLGSYPQNGQTETGIRIFFDNQVNGIFAGDGYIITVRRPRAYHWVQSNDNTVHQLVECSGQGTCDRSTGTCMCYAGYLGAACERMSCPNGCSGRGLCVTEHDLRAIADAYHITTQSGYGSLESRALYTDAWDAHKATGCYCDPGYRGYDCSLKECPSLPDPLLSTIDTPNPAAVDCSGRGICDYRFGQCRCFRGYAGVACEFQTNLY